MANKDTENFDFETESESTGKFNLGEFLKNLSKKQKGIILVAIIGVVLVTAIVVVSVIMLNQNSDIKNPSDVENSGAIDSDNDTDDNEDGEIPSNLTQLFVASPPTKTTYYVGEQINYNGLNIGYTDPNGDYGYLYYSDDPDSFVITGFDSSAPVENQVITVECRGLTTTFTVTIKEIPLTPPVLSGIHVDPLPKTEYKMGEMFTVEGGKIVCTYDDGTTKTIDLIPNYVSGFGAMSKGPGEYTITVKYRENGVTMKTTYTITVTE